MPPIVGDRKEFELVPTAAVPQAVRPAATPDSASPIPPQTAKTGEITP